MNGEKYEWDFNGRKNDGGSRFEDIVQIGGEYYNEGRMDKSGSG